MRTTGFNSKEEREEAKKIIARLKEASPQISYGLITKAFEAQNLPRPSKHLIAQAIESIRYEKQSSPANSHLIHFYIPPPITNVVQAKAASSGTRIDLIAVNCIKESNRRLLIGGLDAVMVTAIKNHRRIAKDLTGIHITNTDAAICLFGSNSRAFLKQCGLTIPKGHKPPITGRLSAQVRIDDHIHRSVRALAKNTALSMRGIYSAMLVSGLTPVASISDDDFFTRLMHSDAKDFSHLASPSFARTERLLKD